MRELSEEIRGIAKGDHAAFTRLYRAESRALLALATGILAGDRSAAEDVVDAAFIGVWQGAKQYQGYGDAQAKGWLRRIMRNKAVDWLRANGRFELGLEDDLGAFDADPAVNPEQAAQTSDASTRLAAALARLSFEQREAVMLCYFEDLPLAAIAEIARCPEGTVKTRLFHARKALKFELAPAELLEAAG
ncbi:MAG: RNA polymerase sigma factor [Novosphingobium sp.]|uniref:RNA polymerase sigma factor n=1 Tax=Novosphingobium sp. TaxID=1874826 RepID=UPI0032BD8116